MPAKRSAPIRIVFIGAECTGKTTAIEAIAKTLGEPCSKEYVREYADSVDRPLEARDLDSIARGQLQGEDKATQHASKYVFHDTNLLSSILYAEHYFDVHIPWVDETFLKRDYSHYFLCLPDIPWEADPGQRVSAEERAKLHLRFQEILSRYSIEPTVLSGTLEQRVETALSTLQ